MNNRRSKNEFKNLIDTALADPLIKKRILEVLKLNSFKRRAVLNIWLEQLRQQNAPKKLTNTLFYLFDDIIAEETLKLINNHNN
jgi:hypothetical protein